MLHHFLMFEFFDNIPAQIFGFIALAAVVVAFQINNRKRIIIAQSASFFMYAIHYFLLNAYSGSVLQLLGVFRNYSFIKYRERFSSPIVPIIFILLFVVAAALTWEGLISLLPMSGMIMGAIAFWQKNTKVIRLFNLPGPVVWFIYSFIKSSYFGMLGMAFVLISVLVAIIRYDILHRPEPAMLKEKLKIVD